MRKIKDFVKRNAKKHGKKFSLFLSIGILKIFLLVAFSWLTIDLLKINSILGSIISVAIVFIITYFIYVISKVIKANFLKYTSTAIGFNIVIMLLIWFFVDFVGFSGSASSAIVTGSLFIGRYLFFNKIGLIRYD